MCDCVRVRAGGRVRACVRACVCACVCASDTQAAYDTLDPAVEAAEEVGERCRVAVESAALELARERLGLLESEHAHVLF